MGSIVKSIGKAIKKVGKGIAKVVKKIWPALLVAAAVYTGVAFYGSTLAGASGATLGTSNFMAGLGAIGKGVAGFFSPTGSAAATAGPTTQALASSGNVFASGNLASTAGGAFASSVTTETAAAALAAKAPATLMSSVAGGMSSGDALVYMTKMNMLATGVKMVAGFLDDSEKEQMQHDKELLSMRYAYGKPMTDEQKAWKAENPNWITNHPAIASTQRPPTTSFAANAYGSQTMNALPSQTTAPPPYVQQQKIGQPTFGRGPARQFETPATRAMVSKGPGLITKGAQGRFNPTQQRYS